MNSVPEMQDIYDENRKPLGKTAPRWEERLPGEYSLYISVWVTNGRGELLITLRDKNKKYCPSQWENTGGAVLMGETSAEGCSRELFEETGIAAPKDKLILLETHMGRNTFLDTFAFVCDDAPKEIRLQPGETDAARWVSRAEFETMCETGEVAPPIAECYSRVKPKLEPLLCIHNTK